MASLQRNELIELVRRIMESDGAESEIDHMISLVEANVPHPELSDLIFWPPDGKQRTAEQVVDEALAYRPIVPPTS